MLEIFGNSHWTGRGGGGGIWAVCFFLLSSMTAASTMMTMMTATIKTGSTGSSKPAGPAAVVLVVVLVMDVVIEADVVVVVEAKVVAGVVVVVVDAEVVITGAVANSRWERRLTLKSGQTTLLLVAVVGFGASGETMMFTPFP